MFQTAAPWIMAVTGLLTMTMAHAAFASQTALKSMFGEALHGQLAEVVVRNWGALIALVGAALVYGAYEPLHRAPILIFAGASKLVFIALMLSIGRRYLTGRAATAVTIDCVALVLFGLILLFG